jgi:chromosome partitioning protein
MQASSVEWKILESGPVEFEPGRVVGIANQKGGVGKTTTALNLATGLALRGHRILVVDADPQSNATTGMGIDHRRVGASTYDLLMNDAPLRDVVVETAIAGLYLVPGSLDLAGAELELVGAIARERRLADGIARGAGAYDLILVDCPPSLGLVSVNALAAARDLIVPVQCEYYALEGLGKLLETAERVRRSLNPALRISGFVLTMYDARTKLAEQVAADVRGHFGELAFKTVIPRSVRLSEAPSFGEPVLTLDPTARGAIAYRLLTAEVEDRYRLRAPADDPMPKPATPGPGGRGFGTITPEPPGLDEIWPRPTPWE